MFVPRTKDGGSPCGKSDPSEAKITLLSSSATSKNSSQSKGDEQQCTFNFRASSDAVLPSIENTGASNQGSIFHFTASPSAHLRAPSATFSASESPERFLTPTGPLSPKTETNPALHLPEPRLSTESPSMDLSSISTALRDLVGAQYDRGSSPFLEPKISTSASPSPSAHSRRASSRLKREPHNVEDEAPPNDLFNSPVFQKAFSEARTSMRTLANVLSSSKLHGEPDSIMHRLHNEAESLAKFQCPSTRIVGFVGDSGVGKSSLLNSLLDIRGLARTSNSGAACTCVVTEYRFHPEQGFTIEIERFSKSESTAQIESLLKDYRYFHTNKGSVDRQELKDLEDRANLARDTFRAMFRGLLVHESMLTSTSEAQVLQTFEEWANTVAPRITGDRLLMTNAEECANCLMELTSEDGSSDSAAAWPWIKKIRVYANAHILSKGLVLVDLPGLRDLNVARRHITERFLLKCDEIFVVCNEGRAITDEGVQAVVDLAKKAELSNVGIVCTRSDDIDAEEAQKDWKGQKAREIQEKVKAISSEIRTMKKIESDIADYDDTPNEDLNDEEKDELNTLHSNLRATRRRRDEQSFLLQEFLISHRNANVQSQLLSSYKQKVPGDSLKVFCISNKIYWEKRGEAKDKAMRHLELSGILGLREHCMALVSMSQHAAALKYMKTDIGVLLGELGLWVHSGSGSRDAEQKERIRATLATIEKKLQLELRGPASNIGTLSRLHKQHFRAKVMQVGRGSIEDWSTSAKYACNDWSCWHHSSYAAFCRNYGDHTTPKQGSRNWNGEMIQKMASDLNIPWRLFCIDISTCNDDAVTKVEALFDWSIKFLGTNIDEASDARLTLMSTLESHRDALSTNVQDILDKGRDDLRIIRTDAMSSIRSSYIGTAMKPAYEEAMYESGSGSDARRKGIIRNAVYHGNLIPTLMRKFEKALHDNVDEVQNEVRKSVEAHLDNICATFDIIRDENAALESESDDEFRARVDKAVAAATQEMEDIVKIVSSS
ncbi:hypothetical protein F5Y16DRAFT_375824 [Xylariaceae sp. FL0255]|nr:hypothetical protein F5Y16DRAFT_375824 [Xylariaceae sp. FL0255]